MINIKRVLFFLLIISFLSLLITGLIKFPGLINYLGLSYSQIPFGLISKIHDWMGIITSVLIITHLYLNLNFIMKYLGVKK
ncbi:MAG: DUF4405 domain-containing protein [Nanoarchaeota archaeon]|nr:DUF4405 domain-containing protein [Nanoarchaeota archaeon]